MEELRDLDLELAAMRVGRFGHSLTVRGEIDMHSAAELRAALEAIPDGVRHVLVDLRGVPMIDSVGLAILVTNSRRLAAAGARMLLVVDDPRIRRVLEVTGIERFFDLRGSQSAPTRELVGSALLEALAGGDQ